ncbi:MAG: hypothetical protein AAGD92_07340 [Pseudomonadota bacterium]
MNAAAPSRLSLRSFFFAFLWVSLFVHPSEIARYLFFVMPMTREFLAALPDAAPLDPFVFASWGVWTSILASVMVVSAWLSAARFGPGLGSAFFAGGFVWIAFFVLFWLGAINMGVGSPGAAVIALPWALAECLIACVIARWSLKPA